MRDLSDVLRDKEAQLKQVQAELDALRLAVRLCAEDDTGAKASPKKAPVSATAPTAEDAQVGGRRFP